MSVPLLDLKAQHATIRDEVVAAVMGVVDSQLFILGEPVAELERAVAALSHTRHAIGCANGTDALLLALRALDVGRGDEVITTPFTFFATAGTIHNVGATPVFVDIEPDTFNILPAAVAAARRPATKAVVPVDLFGQMAPIETIAAAVPGLPIIEDAAQSIGARRMIDGEWRMAGEVATIGTFSFFPSKNLGGYGDGGMLVTQNDAPRRATEAPARARGRQAVLPRRGRLQLAASTRCRPRCCRAKLPHLAGWSAKRREQRRVLRRGVRRPGGRAHARRAPGERVDLQPVHDPRAAGARRRCRRSSRRAASAPRSTIRCRCTSSRASRTWAIGRGSARRASAPRGEVLSLPIFPELSDAQLDEVVAGVRAFFGR